MGHLGVWVQELTPLPSKNFFTVNKTKKEMTGGGGWGGVFITVHIFVKPFQILAGLGSSTIDQVLKYTKYPKYIPSTNTGQVLIFLKST